MKHRFVFTGFILAVALLAGSVIAQEMEFPRPSPKASITQTVGTTSVTVNYCRPGVKGREIWGKLVPYNEPWRTGANEATTIVISDPVSVEGKTLPAGTYAFFTIPTTSDWTVVFSKQTDLWGSFGYKPEMDALRVTVKPVAGEFVERMQFVFTDVADNAAVLELQWEKLRVPIHLTVDTTGKILTAAGKNMGSYGVQLARAANYFLQTGSNFDVALKCVNTSIAIQENYNNLSVKARLLEKLGQKAEAIITLERAIKLGKEAKQPPYGLAEMEKLLTGWKK